MQNFLSDYFVLAWMINAMFWVLVYYAFGG